VRFETLWRNYPSEDPYVDSKTGQPPTGFANQCAIRLGYALAKSGVSFGSYQGKFCPGVKKNTGMVAVAQELANWLNRSGFPGCPKSEVYTGKTVFDKIEDRTGIIFLANYWQRPGDSASTRTGDHIDLWNGSRMTAFTSWFRVNLGISWDGVWSDFTLASKVNFWPIP
jgi:hypothetical protein